MLGAEVLRSLVLPGLGKITVLDDALVTYTDLGNKFVYYYFWSITSKPPKEAVNDL